MTPTIVAVSTGTKSVVAGQSVSITCTVNSDATTPIIFMWKRIQNGGRIDPPTGAQATPQGERSNQLVWTSVGWQDGGQYECQASNQVGSRTSSPATLIVYYAADSVTLAASATTVNAGTSGSLTCSSSGGNPRPGLVIYDVTGGGQLNELVQSSDAATLTFSKLMQKSDNGAKYACKTNVNVAGVTIPVKTSNTITMNVQFSPNGLDAPQSLNLDESQTSFLRCQTTSSSNPETTLVWSGPGLGAPTTSTSRVDYGVKTVLDVSVTADRTRNDAIYTCTAKHLNQQIFTTKTTLNVNCK